MQLVTLPAYCNHGRGTGGSWKALTPEERGCLARLLCAVWPRAQGLRVFLCKAVQMLRVAPLCA